MLHGRVFILLFVISVVVGSGCFRRAGGGSSGTPERVSPAMPVELYPAASSLNGAAILDVLTFAEKTVDVVPLDSGLIREVAAKVNPAVVSIFTKTQTDYQSRLIPGVRFSVDGEALGSGFFIHSSGYLISNSHVIEDATEIIARTAKEKDYQLEVIARDRVYDLALLKVVNADESFPVIPMGVSEEVLIGDWVIAVGNPLGLGHTVTHGIISQTGRALDPELAEGERQVEFLQTDTPINPGSSGGPLVTLTGAWVGVNTAVIINSQGISFCVPSFQVREFLENVIGGNGIQK